MSVNKLHFEVNRTRWNKLVQSHVESAFYDLEGFRAGKSSLKAPELDFVGDPKGKSLLHLQCHFGQDTLSWARMGAQVTGMDFSDEAIAQAQQLASELNIPAHFVVANVYELPQHLQGQFDIVFSSYGALPWLPDLEAWAEVITHFMKAGGSFVLAEFHPMWQMLEFNSLRIDYSYFNPIQPYEEWSSASYADNPDAPQRPSQQEFFWNHSLAEVVGALLRKGLVLERFEEYDYSAWNCFPNLVETGPGRWEVKGKEGLVPLMYAIRMRKPS